MKQLITFFILTISCIVNIHGQSLTVQDLMTLCGKKNWEEVNHVLLSKNWVYYDSKKGNEYNYNTITWSYNKGRYEDKAQAWFYLYTHTGNPSKIAYSVFNEKSYSNIQNSIASSGFKLTNSEIKNNEIVSTYSNSGYFLEISTMKDENDEYNYSKTSYYITLTRKNSVYDPDNGKKTEYYYGNVIKAEYTLLNGKLNGLYKSYYSNGKLEKTGNYSNGKEHGLFKEYHNRGDGGIRLEYSMVNGVKNGHFKQYDPFTELLSQTGAFLKGKEHGTFVKYNEKGVKEAEYVMANGLTDGPFKVFYPNGLLKQTGSFLKDKEHGAFAEYDEEGVKEAEYVMANGMKNGRLKFYEDNKISRSIMFKDDIKNGEYIEYYYHDETGELQLKLVGEYLNDEKNGTWKTICIEEKKERILDFENYYKDIKNGPFQEIRGDSLIQGNYKNGKLHGQYKSYFDIGHSMFGMINSTDTSELKLVISGTYDNGLKSGYWKLYNGLFGFLTEEGLFSNDMKTGEWKYYHTTPLYWGQLERIQNYSNGKRNGKTTIFSYYEKIEYPCFEDDTYPRSENDESDICFRFICHGFSKLLTYKDDKLNGISELRDSINNLISKGNYKNDLKDGEWIERYSDRDENDEIYYFYQKGNYRNDFREGKWIQYRTEDNVDISCHYVKDILHGEFILWNKNKNPIEKRQLTLGMLQELTTFDSLGINVVSKYEIFDLDKYSYRCRRTEYSKYGHTIQEYWIDNIQHLKNDNFEAAFLFSTVLTGGYKDGCFKFYNKNNQLVISGEYNKEERTGIWTNYYYDQNIKMESNYLQGQKTEEKYFDFDGKLYSGKLTNDDVDEIKENAIIKGPVTIIDFKSNKVLKKEYKEDYNNTEETIKEVRKIKNGLRHGQTIYIDLKSNKVIKKEIYVKGVLK